MTFYQQHGRNIGGCIGVSVWSFRFRSLWVPKPAFRIYIIYPPHLPRKQYHGPSVAITAFAESPRVSLHTDLRVTKLSRTHAPLRAGLPTVRFRSARRLGKPQRPAPTSARRLPCRSQTGCHPGRVRAPGGQSHRGLLLVEQRAKVGRHLRQPQRRVARHAYGRRRISGGDEADAATGGSDRSCNAPRFVRAGSGTSRVNITHAQPPFTCRWVEAPLAIAWIGLPRGRENFMCVRVVPKLIACMGSFSLLVRSRCGVSRTAIRRLRLAAAHAIRHPNAEGLRYNDGSSQRPRCTLSIFSANRRFRGNMLVSAGILAWGSSPIALRSKPGMCGSHAARPDCA